MNCVSYVRLLTNYLKQYRKERLQKRTLVRSDSHCVHTALHYHTTRNTTESGRIDARIVHDKLSTHMRWLRRHGFVRPNTPVTRDETVVSQDEIVMDHDESQVRDELVDKPAQGLPAEDSQLIVPSGQEATTTKHPRSDADCMDSYQSAPKKQKAAVATAGIRRRALSSSS